MENGLKQQVFEQLRRGRAKAIPGPIIAKRCGFRDDRRIRVTILELIDDGIPIVTSTVMPAGFYIAETKEEVNLYAETMRSRIIGIGHHRKNLIRAAENILNPEQLRLRL